MGYQDSHKQVNYLIKLCFILAIAVGVLSAISVRTHFAAKRTLAAAQKIIDKPRDDKRVLVMLKRDGTKSASVPAAPKKSVASMAAKTPPASQKPAYKPFVSTYVQRRYIAEEPTSVPRNRNFESPKAPRAKKNPSAFNKNKVARVD